jgi:hypothetical protein
MASTTDQRLSYRDWTYAQHLLDLRPFCLLAYTSPLSLVLMLQGIYQLMI